MTSKLFKYFSTALVIAVSFWFYFQLDTYPYKVARWFQPTEARIVSIAAKQCASINSLLNLFADHALHTQGAYSAQIAFLTSDNQAHTCEVGYKDKLFGVPVSATHRYRYASTSKLITTAAIFNLQRQDKINFDDPVVNFFPELTQFKDERIREITIAHLLNHSAGFDRVRSITDPMFLRRKEPWCPHDMKQLQAQRLSFNPGEKQVYSNLGYCLLGEVIHRVVGESYRQYVNREFQLPERNIKFVENFYYDDEVRYDFRYEDFYNDSYLKLFDFEAISSSAGLSGSAIALANLLWEIQHKQKESPFTLGSYAQGCNLARPYGCISGGLFHYQPDKYGIALHFHEGYLPGSSSIAIIDSFGGVTVVVKSGNDRYREEGENGWVRWIYRRLSLYYTLQGKLPLLSADN